MDNDETFSVAEAISPYNPIADFRECNNVRDRRLHAKPRRRHPIGTPQKLRVNLLLFATGVAGINPRRACHRGHNGFCALHLKKG